MFCEVAYNSVQQVEAMSKKPRKAAQRLVARVSYESGLHWMDGEHAAYEALRTRSNTLLSAVLVVVALVVGLLPDGGSAGPSCLSKVGAALVLVGLGIVGAASIYASWPINAVYGFSPVNTWNAYSKHKNVTKAYRSMGEDLEKHCKALVKRLKPRYVAHRVALMATALVMIGLGMEIIDVAY